MSFNYKSISNDGGKLIFFAGPCVIESYEMAFDIAKEIKKIGNSLGIQLVFKASYDKANRTSKGSFRGIGMKEGLEILKSIGDELDICTITDIHTPNDVDLVAQYVDFLQVPAFLSRQTDLLLSASDSGKAVLVKKGQFLSGYDAEYIVEKCSKALENNRLLLCERGTTFGYNNLVVDMRNLEIMRKFAPVIYDATHSVQMPSLAGGISGGAREFIPSLLRAAVAMGIDGIFMEVHPNPTEAKSDSATVFELDKAEALWKNIVNLNNTIKLMI